MYALITLLIGALGTAAAITLSQDQLNAIAVQGTAKTDQIASLNRSGTATAAVIQWQLDRGVSDVPTSEQLVRAGLLDNRFLAPAR